MIENKTQSNTEEKEVVLLPPFSLASNVLKGIPDQTLEILSTIAMLKNAASNASPFTDISPALKEIEKGEIPLMPKS